MSLEYIIVFFGGAIIAMICSMQSVARSVRRQQDILARGVPVQATVLRLWQPPLLGAFARIYFEFQPSEGVRVVRTCHIDRRSAGELSAARPRIGATVAARYLPENPSHAVIVKLVSRGAR